MHAACAQRLPFVDLLLDVLCRVLPVLVPVPHQVDIEQKSFAGPGRARTRLEVVESRAPTRDTFLHLINDIKVGNSYYSY